MSDMKKALGDALSPIGGTIQDLCIERRMFFQQCIANRTDLEIRQIDGPTLVGTYLRHDDASVTIFTYGACYTIAFMAIDGVERLC